MELIEDGLIRKDCNPNLNYVEELNAQEKIHIKTRARRYYDDNWPTLIMSCLQFKEPCIANLENLTSFMHSPDSADPNKIMYFHVDYVMPGKSYYVIKHD